MAIEVEPKTGEETPLVKYSLYIGVALLLIMAGSYAFLYFATNNAQQELEELQNQADQQVSEEDKALQNELVQTQRRFQRAEQVIDSHRSFYNFLEELADNTHPHLRFDGMELTADLNRVNLRGVTENFTVLGQQLKTLREKDTIKEANIESTSVESGGKISFKITLKVDPAIFNFPPEQ